MAKDPLIFQVQRQELLLDISRVVQQMLVPDDLEMVLQICLSAIQAQGIDAQAMAIHRMVDPEAKKVETVRIGPGGLLAAFEVRKSITLYKIWESKQAIVQKDMEQDAVEGRYEAAHLAWFRRTKFNGLPVRCMLNVPFDAGVVSVHSVNAHAFTCADVALLCDMAEILAIGLARVKDLVALSNQKAQLAEFQTLQEQILTHVHCLIWYAIVEMHEEEAAGRFHWALDIPFEEAAQDFLPLALTSGETYAQVWDKSKLPEDRLRMDQVACEALTKGQDAYRQEFRCRGKDGAIRWLFEDVHIDVIGSGQWQLVGICTDITDRKETEAQLMQYQTQLTALVSELSLVEEHTRQRIAAELHDRISQPLAVTRMQLGVLQEKLGDATLAAELGETRRLLEGAIADTRALMYDLSPPVLYEFGLEAGLSWLCERVEDQDGISVNFSDDEKTKPISEVIRVLLFQSVRELLVNAVKHANGSKIEVEVKRTGNQVDISVADNGVGFDPQTVKISREGGFGLLNIRIRLENLGGRMLVQSVPEGGTRIRLFAPLILEVDDAN